MVNFVAGVRTARSLSILNPSALAESWRERGRYPVEVDHRPHLESALDWLVRAQDATADDGFARGFSIGWNRYFRSRGWQPSYPETTGYIIPTFYMLARVLDRPGLADRATRAARWESRIQLATGAVRGGVIGEPESPSIFNTGQVIFGWLAAHEATGETSFAESAHRAAGFLCDVQDPDGHWRRANSRFARGDSTLYNARTAWAIAEAGTRLDVPGFRDAAARNLDAVLALQHSNGWFPNCCLSDPSRPLLHTIAYTIRGLLGGGQALHEQRWIDAAERAASPLAERVDARGWMAGRFADDWSPAAEWSCLTGEAQMANIWVRLYDLTGRDEWLAPAERVLGFLKSTQNRTSVVDGVRGGIRGSYPISGEYGRFEVLNWATKFFIDALVREEHARHGADALRSVDEVLA